MEWKITNFKRGVFTSGYGLTKGEVQIGVGMNGWKSARRMAENIIEAINEEEANERIRTKHRA